MKILFMNSGGKDSEVALQLLIEQNPDAEIQSLTIEVDHPETLDAAQALAERCGVPHFVLPYEQTRQHVETVIDRAKRWATTFWAFNLHYLGLQYAAAHGFDYLASGTDAKPINDGFEELLDAIQDNNTKMNPNRIQVIRPMRHVKTADDYKAMKAKIKNPR